MSSARYVRPCLANPSDWGVETELSFKVTIWGDRQTAFGITAYIQGVMRNRVGITPLFG